MDGDRPSDSPQSSNLAVLRFFGGLPEDMAFYSARRRVYSFRTGLNASSPDCASALSSVDLARSDSTMPPPHIRPLSL